uniref:Kinesin-like protein n=2 Tax=Panagrolaimus sp. PS1159 TaxID=55785 RepID=A0AC35F123_9BILA
MSNNSQLTVAVRVRPLNDTERQRKNFQCVYPIDSERVLLVDPEKFENNILRQNRQHERHFTFDASFGPQSTHEEVHVATTAPLVDFVVAGYNATVFAYGPTGSGKTYTMVGNDKTPGLMMLLTRSLYDKINPHEFTVYLSYLEIYNEVIKDLLNPNAGVLDLLEDERGNVQVPGLSRVKAPNTNRIFQILQEGNSRRTQEPTAANRNSSRSHALLQVTLYKNSVQHGKLFLIDLAGSERASQTQNKGQRLKEGAAINRSLLALGNVINALSTGNKGRYVNYRDSKLTRLLKDSLGGNSKTCMIAHVSPSSSNYDETYNTLVYANRAKNITTR